MHLKCKFLAIQHKIYPELDLILLLFQVKSIEIPKCFAFQIFVNNHP